MKLAYLVNHYPKVSHSFIRREILALEGQGFEVLRVALRGWAEALPDVEDQRERNRTRYVLRGKGALLVSVVVGLVCSPIRFFAALRLATRMAVHSERPLPYHWVYVAEALRIRRWLSEFGANHLHAHFGTNSAEVAMLVHALGGPAYSFTVHGPDEFARPMGLEEKIHGAKFVIAISSFARSQLYLRARFLDWPKIKVVHCGLERMFYEVTESRAAPEPRLCCVGRLCEAKGQLLLVEAAARLAAMNIAFQLVLAGDGPMRSAIENLIRQHGLEDRVRISGWISSAQVRDEILASRALVLPSFAEGLPVVIMEAMALRRPVITTYVAGIPELVRHGQNGWIFPAGSVETLVEAMAECLSSSPETLQAMGDFGHNMVVARHSVEVEASKLAELFRASVPPSDVLPREKVHPVVQGQQAWESDAPS